jgi:probable F420-dependent oxidoreductase
VRFGVGFFATDQTVPPGELGPMVEQRGFGSIFLTEHTHIPADHSPYPGGGELPEWYKRTLDPFVALAAIAQATERLRLGFGITLVPQHDPIVQAKAVATLDWISGGRVDLGIGAGWNQPEVENHGTPFERRFKVMRERVEAMRALWTEDEASYAGEFVSFERVWSWPKPVQDPLPVYVGGNGERVLDRVLRYGDHWMPNREPGLAERIAELRSRAQDAGRPRPNVAYFGVPLQAEAVERMAAAGVDECLLMIRTGPGEVVEECLDRAAAVREQFA